MATKDTKKSAGRNSNASLAPRRATRPAEDEFDTPQEERAAIEARMNESLEMGFEEAAAQAAAEEQDTGPSTEPIVIKDKEVLVGCPILVVGYSFKTDDKYGAERTWAKVHLLLPGDQPAIITDGSTGIAKQLQARAAAGKPQRHFVPNGLRVSRYKNKFTDEGETFYLDYAKSKEEVDRLLKASKGASAVKAQQALNRASARN